MSMHTYQDVPFELFQNSPFTLIGDQWMLITAEKEGKVNAMTASWGGLGVMWGKNVSYVVIRNSRYTKEFVDASDAFSLCFFDQKFKPALKYMGAVSGRNEDKIKNAKMKIEHFNEIPYFDDANIIIYCKKMFAAELSKEHFISPEIEKLWYKEPDYHVLYISEITGIYAR